MVGNYSDVDHLTRKRVGTSHANYAQGYFETSLRANDPILRYRTLIRRNLINPVVDKKG
jgi:hypothetical protein